MRRCQHDLFINHLSVLRELPRCVITALLIVISTISCGDKIRVRINLRCLPQESGEISSDIEYSTFHKTFNSCGYFLSILIREIPAVDFVRDFGCRANPDAVGMCRGAPDESGFEMTNLVSLLFRVKTPSLRPLRNDSVYANRTIVSLGIRRDGPR